MLIFCLSMKTNVYCMYVKGGALQGFLWFEEYHKQSIVQPNTVSIFHFLISNCGQIITGLWPPCPRVLLRILELCSNVVVCKCFEMLAFHPSCYSMLHFPLNMGGASCITSFCGHTFSEHSRFHLLYKRREIKDEEHVTAGNLLIERGARPEHSCFY